MYFPRFHQFQISVAMFDWLQAWLKGKVQSSLPVLCSNKEEMSSTGEFQFWSPARLGNARFQQNLVIETAHERTQAAMPKMKIFDYKQSYLSTSLAWVHFPSSWKRKRICLTWKKRRNSEARSTIVNVQGAKYGHAIIIIDLTYVTSKSLSAVYDS